jgi:Fe-S-cluster containining protein
MTTPSWQQHQMDEDGDHDPEECYACLSEQAVSCDCRCAECCKRLIIEATVEDAEREPLIAEKGSPIYAHPELTESGKPELEGYMLNGGKGCVFLNPETSLCGIYETRPLSCRLFNCDGEDRDRLVQLGILPPKGERER